MFLNVLNRMKDNIKNCNWIIKCCQS
jgi:hypothetical protein